MGIPVVVLQCFFNYICVGSAEARQIMKWLQIYVRFI